jgi:protease I
MGNELKGRRIAILAARGVEEVELVEPRRAVTEAGAETELLSIEPGEIQAVRQDIYPTVRFSVERLVSEASVDDYDGLILPGGAVNPDTLRQDEAAVAFVRAFVEGGKPVGAICHAPWTLIEAEVVRGRTVTSYPSLRTDLRNAGADWVDREVVTDQGLVTSRRPDDLPAFCSRIVEEFAEGRHAMQGTGARAARAGSGPLRHPALSRPREEAHQEEGSGSPDRRAGSPRRPPDVRHRRRQPDPVNDATRRRRDAIRWVTVRHEESGACAAGAEAPLTGELTAYVIVYDNGAVGMVNLEMQVAGLVDWQTDLKNPDFAALARSIGFLEIRVEDPQGVRPALQEALRHPREQRPEHPRVGRVAGPGRLTRPSSGSSSQSTRRRQRGFAMTVRLNRNGYEHGRECIEAGRVVLDEMDDWSEHQPSAEEENRFIEEHGWREYGRWHLGIDDEATPETKGHYKFPYGDFEAVHRCGVIAAEVRAARLHYEDIRAAAAHLHGMLETLKV